MWEVINQSLRHILWLW